VEALIAGGGIAGAVTAMALQKAGISSTVFEAYPPMDPELGSYFTVTANGLAALDAADALDAAVGAGFPTRRNVLWNGSGRRLATFPLDSRLPGSLPARTMKRSRLVRLLQDEAVRRGIRIEFGRRLVDAAVGSDGRITAMFEGGAEARGDVLVGADGIHSVVRRIIDPMAPEARYVGLANFGGFTRGAGGGIEPEAWHLIFGRRAFFGYHATPDGDVVWFANVPRPMVSAAERRETGEADWKRQLVDLFADDHGPASELIGAGQLELAGDNTHDLGHVPTWQHGQLVVIGDAAHAPAPTSGQGASMAIEDGVVLARQLRDQRSIPEALATFEQLRRERVEKIVAWGARGSSNKMPGAFGRLARDVTLRLIFRIFITEKSLAWMYDYRVGLDDDLIAAASAV
jgi:2-polyprenyl-6-methoxyphenol hydroxylase-like FAD-dependent oxidoreductase